MFVVKAHAGSFKRVLYHIYLAGTHNKPIEVHAIESIERVEQVLVESTTKKARKK